MTEKDFGYRPENNLGKPRWWIDAESQHGSHLMNPDETRDDQIFAFLPFADLRTWIYEDELLYQAEQAFHIARLGGVKQLSVLAYVGPSPDTQYLISFNHTRLQHTDQVAKVGEAILSRNNASDADKTLYVISAALHDNATPALGDAVKKIDQANLNEEDFWQENLDEEGFEFIEANGVTREQIDDVIHNRGIVGQVLDIADRISYVTLDLYNLMDTMYLDTRIHLAETLGYREEIAQVLKQDVNFGSIYRDLVIDWENNDFYFTNPERLSRFLEIRALLNKYLYLHPASQGRDMLVSQFVRPYYTTDESDKTKLTPNRLRRMTDDNAVDFLAGKHPELEEGAYASLGRKVSLDRSFNSWYPQYWAIYGSAEEMEAKKAEVIRDGFFFRGSLESKGFNPLTHYKVLTDKGEILPFKDYDSECSARIERVERDSRGHILFWEEKGRDINALTQVELDLE